MTFAELQNAILAEGFSQQRDRGGAKRALNIRGAKLYALDDNWAFRAATATVTVTAGSGTITGLPADLARASKLFASDGTPLPELQAQRFDLLYYNNTLPVAPGLPEAWTSVNGVLTVGPASTVDAADYRLHYVRRWVDMADDTDVPGLPTEFHSLLVTGGIAELAALKRDFNTAAVMDQFWDIGVEALRAEWLATPYGEGEQWGSWADAAGGSW